MPTWRRDARQVPGQWGRHMPPTSVLAPAIADRRENRHAVKGVQADESCRRSICLSVADRVPAAAHQCMLEGSAGEIRRSTCKADLASGNAHHAAQDNEDELARLS